MVTSGCHVGSYKSGRRSLGTDECCYAVECFHPFIFYFFFFFFFLVVFSATFGVLLHSVSYSVLASRNLHLGIWCTLAYLLQSSM